LLGDRGRSALLSEYQSYEFLALDRPLTSKQMAELRAISTRAEITPTRFWNEYQWGDLKADPAKLVERYFDAHMYFANWGTHRVMFRIPATRVDTKALHAYFVGDAARARVAGQHLVLDLTSQDEERDSEASQGSLCALVPIRTELMRGDLRVAYLAWLLALQAGDVSDEDVGPAVPPGLSALTAAQAALAEFLRIDEDLLAAAATDSDMPADDTEAVRAWATALSPRSKDRWLARAIEDPDLALGAELRRAFLEERQQPRRPERRVADLLAAAEEVREKRERAQRLAHDQAKKAADAVKKRRLDVLATRLDSAWSDLERMVDRKEYDAAMKLARDLRDLTNLGRSPTPFATRFEEVRKRLFRRRGFFDRWKQESEPDRGSHR
jgi:hypothetical protein